MAAITTFSSDGWVPGSTVTAHLPVAVGQAPGATINSQVADADGDVTFTGLTPGLSYIAISGSRRASFTLPDRAGELRSLGIREPDATIIAAIEAGISELETIIGGGEGLNITISSGVGSPETVVEGSPGDVYLNESGGALTTIYVKESGTGTDTGWVGLVSATTLLASGKGFCNHGAVAGTARPSGYVSVEWVGSVEPSNAVNGDTWIDTT